MLSLVSRARWLFIFLFFIATYLSVFIAKQFRAEWVGRVIALSIFNFVGLVAIFWFATVSFRMKPLASGVNPAVQEKILYVISAGAVIFGIFFFIFSAFPFLKDLSELMRGRRPDIIRGAVTDISTPLGGVWFIREGVVLDNDKDATHRYSLFFSLEPLRYKKNYQLVVLKNSRAILEFKLLD